MALSANVEKLFKSALSMAHPDRHEARWQDLANELTKRLNTARDAGDESAIIKLHKELKDGVYFVDLNDAVSKLKEEGYTKAEVLASIKRRGWDAEKAKAAIEAVYGVGRPAADHAKAITVLIRCKQNGRTNKETIAELCEELGWKESTAVTLLAYYSYMQEYAKQINA